MMIFNITKEVITRFNYSPRGGGIEISLDTAGFEGGFMTAYQNYLGGGMLGCICNSCNLRGWQSDPNLVIIAEQLRNYYSQEVHGKDASFFKEMPKSAY